MTEKEFIDNLESQFESSEDLKFDINSNFKDSSIFDSLTGMCIIVMMKDDYGVDLSEEEFRKLSYVRDLYEKISK